MGKFIVEKHNGESIWRLYENEYGDIAGEEAYLTLYTEPDLEQVRKEAYEEGYKKCLSLNNFGHLCVSCDKYEQGLADAWDAARKIELGTNDGGLSADTMTEIFGTLIPNKVLRDFTASEVIEKLRAYEQEQEEIKVGDEVNWMGDKYAVIYVRYDAKKADLISCNFGNACENVAFSALTKTGRHFPEIATVLEKMRGEQNG